MKKILAVLVALVLGVATLNAAESYKSYNWNVDTFFVGIDASMEKILEEVSQCEEFDREACEAALANNTIYTDVSPDGVYTIFSSEAVTLVWLERKDSFSVSVEELTRTGAFQKAVDLGNNLYYLVNWDGTAGYYFAF